MPFDLETKIRIDYSEVDRLDSEIQARTSGAAGTAKVKVAPEIDKSSLDPALRDLKRSIEARAPGIFEPLGKALDLSPEVRKLTSEFQSEWQKAVTLFETGTAADLTKALEGVEAKAGEVAAAIAKTDEVKLDTSKALSGLDALKTKYDTFLSIATKPAVLGGVGLMAGGAVLAGSLASSSIQAAQAEKMMEKSTKLVFGTAAAEYEAQAQALAESTGFMATELEAAQIAFNKMATSVGMENRPVKPLTQVATDLAANTGLPQYANDIQAVTRAITSGIGGTADALLDFGIRMDDAYVLSLKVNEGFAAMGEAITPAQMAQARYNALMEQTAEIYGTASETVDDYGRSMRVFEQKMLGAKAAVGEVLIPIANAVADFVSSIPEPLLKVGIWGGIFAGLAAGLGGLVIFLNAVRKAVVDLGSAAATTATQVEAAAMAEKSRGAASGGGLPGGGLPGRGLPGGGTATGAGGWLSRLGGAMGYSGGGLSAGAGYAGVGTLGAGIAGGMILAAPAVIGAGLLMKYGENMEKNAQAELDAATERYRMNAVRVAKLTGATIPAEAAEQAARQGVDMSRQPTAAASSPVVLSIILKDQTSGGLLMSDSQSYAESPY
ncbi:MAG: hypothetical protein JXA87_07850 [Thermoleophilia bacterium]|nr:hypothetical protein [Thermoleophilia bacterium]